MSPVVHGTPVIVVYMPQMTLATLRIWPNSYVSNDERYCGTHRGQIYMYTILRNSSVPTLYVCDGTQYTSGKKKFSYMKLTE